ncbi:MAG TPA: TIGR02996 domain-containing protein [Pirellulales bacterium]
MSDAVFLQAILAAPDDDAPRLIYADWLEEAGEEERAELIRVQIELDQLTEPKPFPTALPELQLAHYRQEFRPSGGRRTAASERWKELSLRVQRILQQRQREWLPKNELGRRCTWRRGFVNSIHLSAPWTIARQRDELEQLPTTDQLTLSATPHFDPLPHLPDLPCLRALGLFSESSLDDAGLKRLIERWPQLESLNVSGRNLTDAGVERLLALPRLREVSLRGASATSEGLALLGALPHLEGLDVSAAPLATDAGSIVPRLPHLKRLTISASQLAPGELARLNRDRPLDVLRIVAQRGAGWGDDSLEEDPSHLLELSSVRALELNGFRFTESFARRLHDRLPMAVVRISERAGL